jgi:hypothetical protein
MFWLGARRRAAVALGAILLGSAAVAAVGAGASVSAIGKLEPGLWQLRDLDDTRAAQQSICVADPNLCCNCATAMRPARGWSSRTAALEPSSTIPARQAVTARPRSG